MAAAQLPADTVNISHHFPSNSTFIPTVKRERTSYSIVFFGLSLNNYSPDFYIIPLYLHSSRGAMWKLYCVGSYTEDGIKFLTPDKANEFETIFSYTSQSNRE